jgi:hypothetical protein
MAGQPPWLPIPGRSCLVKLLLQVSFRFFSRLVTFAYYLFVGIVAYVNFIVYTINIKEKIGDLVRSEFLTSDPFFCESEILQTSHQIEHRCLQNYPIK